MADAYLKSGSVVFSTAVFRSLAIIQGCSIKWSEVTPNDTSISVYVKLSSGEYTEIQNGGSFEELFSDADIANETLFIKVALSTNDETVTPIFSNLSVLFWDEERTIIYLRIAEGNTKSIQNAVGEVTVAYTSGTLEGMGGAVAPFEMSFIPEDLKAKNNPHDAEHVEVSNVVAKGVLTPITHVYVYENEHVNVRDIVAKGNLISIDDI